MLVFDDDNLITVFLLSRGEAEFIFVGFSDKVSVLLSLTPNNLITVLFMSSSVSFSRLE
jgi:hypothetical protein